MFENLFPYTDFHELNLDAILRMIKELHHEWSDFKAVNAITNAGAWDITKQYQAWTIVSDNNVGYISLKPVPAGVAITNTEYWGLVADYDILITDLSNRISSLENDNIINKADISNLKTDKVNKVKKILIVGDSYLDRTNSYGDYLTGSLTDATVVLRGEAGAGFTHYSTLGNRTFEGILSLYASGLTDDEKTEFTDIICIGGSNDRGTASATIKNAIDSFYTTARINFINANMHLGFLGWTGFSNIYQSADKLSFLAAKKDYYDACFDYNLTWIENLNYLMHDYSHYADEGHPDATLSERIGRFLYKYLTTGHADAVFQTSATFTLNTNNFSIGVYDNDISKISASVNNGVTIFKVNGDKPNFANYGKIALTATGLPTNGGLVPLCTLSGGGVFGIEDNDTCNPILITVPATLTNTNNSLIHTEVTFLILHGSLSIIFINGLVNSYTNIIHITLGGFEIVLDTDYA